MQSNSQSWAFIWHIYVWPRPILKVKVFYISTTNIFEMVTDMIKMTIAIMALDWHACSWPWTILKTKVEVIYITPINISETVTYCTKNYWHQKPSYIWAFDWHTYVWPRPILHFKVNVIYISTVNIMEMVTDEVKITIAIK